MLFRSTALFADNVALDDTLQRRCDAARTLVQQCGPLSVTSVHADTLTRGTVTAQGALASVTISLQLAPLAGAPVQWYEVSQPG